MLGQTIAIIGATASGKSELSLKMAKDLNANILSLDSLSIYKEIDIASAKPSIEQRGEIKHFGIDLIYPDESFSVATFIELFKEAKKISDQQNKSLIIVGGTSFYLKALIDGISPLPKIDSSTRQECDNIMSDLTQAYRLLLQIDPYSAKKIASSDSYRIQKLLLIYLASKMAPSEWFRLHPKEPILTNFKLLTTDITKEQLLKRITERTHKMMQSGLIDEVCYLESKYSRAHNSLKSIGIKETLLYLDGYVTKEQLIEQIIINTSHLAKRQNTFNKSQFML